MIKAMYSLAILLVFCSFSPTDHPFCKVLDNVKSKKAVSRLRVFHNGGIEKPVDTCLYTSEQAIQYAMKFKSAPHRMGGHSIKGTDCSGLVMEVHRQFNIHLPHNCEGQARYGKVISEMDSLKRGDLVFFCNSYKCSSFITHAGIYLGDKEFIHASHSAGVIVSNINDPYYWGKRFIFGTRLK